MDETGAYYTEQSKSERRNTKDSNAGKDQGQEVKGARESEMFGWHHQLNGYEFERTPRDGKGQGSLACCSPWGYKKSWT